MNREDEQINVNKVDDEPQQMSKGLKAYWIWVLGSFAVIILCALIEPLRWICVPVTGQLMAGLGLAFLIKSKKRFKTVCFYLVFIIVGVLLFVASLLSKFVPGFEPPKETVAGIVMFVGLCAMVWPIISYNYDKKKCTEEVEAECIDLIRNRSSQSGGSRSYTPMYRYTYRGKVYEVCNSSYTNYGNPYVGERLTLYVAPEDPEYFFDKRRSLKSGIGIILIGAFMFALSGLAMVILIWNPWG